MRIVYLCGFTLASEVAASQRVLSVAKLLTELGHTVTFIDVNPQKAGTEDWHGFPVTSFISQNGFVGGLRYKVALAPIRRILSQTQGVRLVIAYNYAGLSLLRLQRYCKRCGIRVASDAADWPQPLGSPLHRALMKLDIDVRMRNANRRMDGLIAITRYLARTYPTVPSVILPPVVDLRDEKWQACRVTQGYADPTVRLVTVNTAGPGKENLPRLFAMLCQAREAGARPFTLEVIGMTREQYAGAYHTQVPEALVADVTFAGRLSHRETIARIARSAYFVFIRDSNRFTEAGFPTKYCESIACGTPVLTTRTSDLAAYLQPGDNGFFVENGAELGRILAADNGEITRMKAFCLEDDRLDYRRFAADMAGFLQTVVGSAPPHTTGQ